MLRATAQQFDFTSTLGLISDRRWMNQHESMTNSIRSAAAPRRPMRRARIATYLGLDTPPPPVEIMEDDETTGGMAG